MMIIPAVFLLFTHCPRRDVVVEQIVVIAFNGNLRSVEAVPSALTHAAYKSWTWPRRKMRTEKDKIKARMCKIGSRNAWKGTGTQIAVVMTLVMVCVCFWGSLYFIHFGFLSSSSCSVLQHYPLEAKNQRNRSFFFFILFDPFEWTTERSIDRSTKCGVHNKIIIGGKLQFMLDNHVID